MPDFKNISKYQKPRVPDKPKHLPGHADLTIILQQQL